MVTDRKITVNPRRLENGKHVLVHDEHSRVIPFREGGTTKTWNTVLQRRINDGDLELVGLTNIQPTKAKQPKEVK